MFRTAAVRFTGLATCLLLALASGVTRGDTPSGLCARQGVHGGLCVMVGSDDAAGAIELAQSGRYLVHMLVDGRAVEGVRSKLDAARVYGLASAEAIPADRKLPYTENLVNAIFLGARGEVPLSEVVRVLRPGGVVFVGDRSIRGEELTAAGLEAAKDAAVFVKPRPAAIDEWTHPRHGADGNAVSRDEVMGLPQRIRWVAGPQLEIANFVTSGGRAYFGGVLARDAFNGLRLWDTQLKPNPARGGFNMTVGSAVQPLAAGDVLVVWHDNSLQALDAATGQKVRGYEGAGIPVEILHEGGVLLSIQKEAITAFDVKTARQLWSQDAPKIRAVSAGEGHVYFLQGEPAKPEEITLVARELATGKPRWKPRTYDWLAGVKRTTYHGGYLACETSTLNDNKPGNILQMVRAGDGAFLWNREFIPGAAHKKQARALFIADLVWVLGEKKLQGLDPRTGEERKSYPASNVHCFPPVASTKYLFSGEMHLTDFASGKIVSNPITKQACSRDAGVVPANGLLYTFPKHCICWPMLRDFAALAPAGPAIDWEKVKFVAERGSASAPQVDAENPASQWPVYRHDAVRSGSTPAAIPAELSVQWTATLGERLAEGPIVQDWRENYYIRGPVGPPVAASGLVCVTRPDAHQVVALDMTSGRTKWTFTANGRVDTAPTLHKGLCLFGCKSGWVYCLRADSGQLVWKLRAAPIDERIVAYGQIESAWPVPGSILIVDNVAYFAAGRQPLADGGVLAFAVEPATGEVRWMSRLNEVPQKNFYGSSGLEFDAFDLLQQEQDAVAMSRWLFDRSTGKISLKWKSGFAPIEEGPWTVQFPRGSWSYAPRNEAEQCKERPYLRPLVVFKGNALFGCSQDRKSVYRRDFKQGEEFDTEWFAGWATYKRAREGGDLYRSQRLAKDAAWTVSPFDSAASKAPIHAMLLAGDRLCTVSAQGELAVLNAKDGTTLSRIQVAPPAWDGLATAGGQVFLTTQDGRVICLGVK